MKITEKFNNNINHDSDIIVDHMSFLSINEYNYAEDRGVYRVYFDFTYLNIAHNRVKAFYNPLDRTFLFYPDAKDIGVSEYEWKLLRNIIVVLVGKRYELFQDAGVDWCMG